MRRNTSLVCFLTITLLISLPPFAYGEKQDANKPAEGMFSDLTEQPKTAVESFDEIAPATPEELRLNFLRTKEQALQGDSSAQNNLGVMYDSGQGVPQDYVEAAYWFRRSAEQGNAIAQDNLALMYFKGQGVPNDLNEAVKWYTKSAEQGNPDAQCSLGFMYSMGFVVPRDEQKGDYWLHKSAEQGNTKAKQHLEWLNAIKEEQAVERLIGIAVLIIVCFLLFLIYKYRKKIIRTIRDILQKRPHLIPAIIAAVMLFGALGQWPDDYYQLLRFVTCCVSVYLAYTAYTWQKTLAVWLFGFIAVLFNPLAPIHFSRELWQYVDIICAVLFAVVAFILRKPKK